ncbi:MAG: hypothetical protein ACODAE_09870 [Gemmatimonadota bacterium]
MAAMAAAHGVLAAAGAGCAAHGAGGAAAIDGEPPTTVRVANYNWSDMAVYVERDGTGVRHRLGTVNSMSEEAFTVSPSIVSGSAGLRLIADPIGSRRALVTHPITVAPGQTVVWTLENNLNLSNWKVR